MTSRIYKGIAVGWMTIFVFVDDTGETYLLGAEVIPTGRDFIVLN